MATQAQSRVVEAPSSFTGVRPVNWKVVAFAVSMFVQIFAGAYAYGRLSERVDTIQQDVQQIKIILMQRAR